MQIGGEMLNNRPIDLGQISCVWLQNLKKETLAIISCPFFFRTAPCGLRNLRWSAFAANAMESSASKSNARKTSETDYSQTRDMILWTQTSRDRLTLLMIEPTG